MYRKRKLIVVISALIGLLTLNICVGFAQVGIGILNPDSAAILHLESHSRGFLPTRLTTAERDNIQNPPNGLTIYNKTVNILQYFNGDCWLNVYQENCTDCHFALALSDSSGSIDRTETDSIQVQVIATQTAGTPQNITFAIYGQLPSGITSTTVGNPIISPNTNGSITFHVTTFTPAGTYLIPIQAFCGSSIHTIVYQLTIEPCYRVDLLTSSTNYVLSDALYAQYPSAPTSSPLCVVAEVHPGVGVSSNDTTIPAFTTGTLPSGSVVGIINNGSIIGKGGDGGKAYDPTNGLTGEGYPGGNALNLTANTHLLNNGYIFGGGGGGSAMAFRVGTPDLPVVGSIGFTIGSGGGGGAGFGLGGNAGTLISYYSPGSDATGGIFGVPGDGGYLFSPIDLNIGAATIVITPYAIGGKGGQYGAPGNEGEFLITISGIIELPWPLPALTIGPFLLPTPVPTPAPGEPGFAIKRNGNNFIGYPDLIYNTSFVKGQVGN